VVAPGGRFQLPPDAPPFARDALGNAKLDTSGGQVTVIREGEWVDARVNITADNGVLVATPKDPFGVDTPAAAIVNTMLKEANADLAARGLRIDELTVDANGQIHVKTSKR
jgi:hypothetical protein